MDKLGLPGDHSNKSHTISFFLSSVVQLYFLTTIPVSNNKHFHLEIVFLVGGSTYGNEILKYRMESVRLLNAMAHAQHLTFFGSTANLIKKINCLHRKEKQCYN